MFRFIAGSAAALLIAAPAPSLPLRLGFPHHHHHHHLLQADRDLQVASAEVNAGQLKPAHHAAAAAVNQIEMAIGKHHHYLTIKRFGLSGVLRTAAHHHHHGHLHNAIAAARAAEKQIKAGNRAQANADLGIAHGHLVMAVRTNPTLLNR
jgi:hypothetical protein